MCQKLNNKIKGILTSDHIKINSKGITDLKVRLNYKTYGRKQEKITMALGYSNISLICKKNNLTYKMLFI